MGTIRSDISWSTADRIVVRGKDFPAEILGKMNLGDFAWLQLTGKAATPQQSAVFNAIVVTLVEHGLTPSAIVARMTYACAPESLQAAVAAGLCGLGSKVVGSMEGAARLLSEALPKDAPADVDLDALAAKVVADYRQRREVLPGFGHVIHKALDPRTPRLFEIAAENGYSGRYIELLKRVQAEAERVLKRKMPINATGVIGAISCELGFSWKITRGFGVMARAIGLIGHIMEEIESPIAGEVWTRTEHEGSAHLHAEASQP